MKHSILKRRDTYEMLEDALMSGWQTIDNVPLLGEGEFIVLTLSGLTRRSKNRRSIRNFRKADSYGPKRVSVNSVESGNYLAAIAWKWPD